MEDFDRIIIKDVVIEIVNLTRATYKEALELKERLNIDVIRNFKKVVIDLRQCEFIDSTFLGAIVYTKKNILDKEGDIRIVKSNSHIRTMIEKVGANRFFSIFATIEAAVQSYDSKTISNNYPFQNQDSRKRVYVQNLLTI